MQKRVLDPYNGLQFSWVKLQEAIDEADVQKAVKFAMSLRFYDKKIKEGRLQVIEY